MTCRTGRSAWDAAYERSALLEAALSSGDEMSGGEGDLVKCYDLITPELALCAALAVGISPVIAITEYKFLKAALYAVKYVSGFGRFV